MKNNNGFFTIDAIASFSVFLAILLTLVPVLFQLRTEQVNLSDRRYAQSQLQGQLLEYLYSPESSSASIKAVIPRRPVIGINFYHEDDLVKGCATWNNAKSQEEEFCLYGKAN